MAAASALHTHLETTMGTIVGISSPDPLDSVGIADVVDILHQADRIFSTFDPDSPILDNSSDH